MIEQSPQICLIFYLKTFGLPPRSSLGFKFLFLYRISKFLWHCLRLLECKRMISHLLLEMLQNKMTFKKAVSKG